MGSNTRAAKGPAKTTPHGNHRTPVYFLSVGGPNTIEDTAHPAHARLGSVGREIIQSIKPKAVVVISAHWQEHPNKIAVNVAKDPGLIYDFHGFPPEYYKIEYPYRGSQEVAGSVIERLEQAGIGVQRVERGLDHGVWVGFLAAFNPRTNPLEVPIVQVSLYDNEDLEQHYRMGQALASLRDDGVLIIGAGMAAHNLQDFRIMRMQGISRTMPYTTSFDDTLKMAVTTPGPERLKAMLDLQHSKDFRAAHPTIEHLLPMYVVAGAADADDGERLWTHAEGSLNWAQYRFGSVL